MTDDLAVNAPETEEYSAMLAEYLAGQTWIGPVDLPLVFHLKKLGAQLDQAGLQNAALASAYLKAFSVLDNRRPGPRTVDGDLPGQRSIFDELDD